MDSGLQKITFFGNLKGATAVRAWAINSSSWPRYRGRGLETRIGTLDLRTPKLRSGNFFPSVLEPRKMSERALVAVVQKAYVQGVSTRRVDDLVRAMGMTGISKSQASPLREELDEKVLGFLTRESTGKWPSLWLDAAYVKVRDSRLTE